MLDEMPKRINSFPDDDIFVTIARGFARARMIRDVIRVLDMVPKFGNSVPSLKLYNAILDVLVKEDIDIAREFYRKKMMGSGVKGDDYTYGILMKGFCLTNRIGDGFKLLQALKNRGVVVNVVVYNTLIHALCKNGKVGRARSLMNEMEVFSNVTFNIMISAYCNEGNVVQALVMMEKCFAYGVLPDVVALTKMIEILCNEKRVSDAVEVLETVEAKGGVHDVVVYNTLLKGFVKAGKVRAGFGFLKEMEMRGCLPNTGTYNVLIEGFCESRMFESALDMFHEMKRVGLLWNFVTFETLIHGFCSNGKTQDGFDIFELMLEDKRGCGRRIAPYNSILYGLYKNHRLDKVLEFLNYMGSSFPRASSRSLMILQSSDLDVSKQILDEMKECGDVPSAPVYASLIQEYCRKGCTKEAIALMNEMIGLGFFPVSSTSNGLIRVFCQQGKAGAAVRLIEDMKIRGCLLDSESYELIMDAFFNRGELQEMVMVFMQMVESGIVPNYSTWNSLVMISLKGKNRLGENKLSQCLIDS